MSEQTRSNFSHPEPVNLLPTPPEAERTPVLNERRRYSRELALAAGEILRVRKESYTDSLTGLGNRKMYDEEFPKLFEFAKANDLPIALAYGDVRGLKRVNDSHTHGKGDQLLKAAASALNSIAREGDIVVRLGGDEFVIIMLGYTPTEGQTQEGLDNDTGNRLTSNFEIAVKEYGIPAERHVGIDLSITTMRENDTPQSMLTRADAEMQAKKDAYYDQLAQQGTTFQDNRVA